MQRHKVLLNCDFLLRVILQNEPIIKQMKYSLYFESLCPREYVYSSHENEMWVFLNHIKLIY